MEFIFWNVLILMLCSLFSIAAVSTSNNISFTNASPIHESVIHIGSPSPIPVVSSAARISSPLMFVVFMVMIPQVWEILQVVIGREFSIMGLIRDKLKPEGLYVERQIQTEIMSDAIDGVIGDDEADHLTNQQMAPEKQAKVDMTTEMMSVAIDDAIGHDEAEEETDELTNQVLYEIGVDVASDVGS